MEHFARVALEETGMHPIDIVAEKIKNDVDLRRKTRTAWRVKVDGRWILYCAGCGDEINTSFTPVQRGYYHVPAHGRCVAGVKAHFALIPDCYRCGMPVCRSCGKSWIIKKTVRYFSPGCSREHRAENDNKPRP